MKAAADNLMPLTLELGGKSPVILGRSADYATAAARVMAGKTLNAGQICLAPDYVLAPGGQAGRLRRARRRARSSACSRPSRTIPTTPRSSPSGTTSGSWAMSTTPGPRAREVVEMKPGRRGLQPAGAPQDPADPDHRPHRRHGGDAGGDLRAGAAGEDLQERRRGDRLRERATTGRWASTISATTRPRRRRCWPARPPAASPSTT